MLYAVLASPMSFFDTTPVGRILTRFQQDMSTLDVMLPRLFEFWSFLTGACITAVILAGVLVPPVLPLAALLIFAGAIIYKYVGVVILDLRKLSMICASPLSASLSGFIAGLDSVRAFNRVEAFAQSFDDKLGDFITAFFWMRTMEHGVTAGVVAPCVALFVGSLAAVLVAMRDYEFMTPSVAGLSLSYLAVLGLRVPAMLFTTSTLEQLMYSVQRIVEYAELPGEEQVQAVAGAPKGSPASAPSAAEDKSWPKDGSVVAHNVSLRYREELPLVLDGVNFTIKSGERMGVVGRTGAGKSTLALAAFRMAHIVEQTGSELLVGGADVRNVPLQQLREGVGMIPQDAWLFSGTLRENLDPFNEFTDEQVFEALDLVRVGDYVRSLELQEKSSDEERGTGQLKSHDSAKTGQGLQGKVNEKGDNFSTGTVQLFCLARVLLRKPKVIFMDEATASVDLETDAAVQHAIRSGFEGEG
ncbi:hypothetical protein CYMTET_49625 [Cymbomonas tetramitiformis]|uniref:ABC transmembrane type-1 domain-containing protein n=1 Tax=Cymbomonas tetramitiformis TaxID=36881 RepID=A0AAE0BRI3_9CHLO|nr:hypothetical protein CYMTET_49625 [Cymbomonas tetramitiformis]